MSPAVRLEGPGPRMGNKTQERREHVERTSSTPEGPGEGAPEVPEKALAWGCPWISVSRGIRIGGGPVIKG